MKKTPRKLKQWAEEAYTSMQKALTLFKEEHPEPSDEDKLELVAFGPLLAAMNRGIKGGGEVKKMQLRALENFQIDRANKGADEQIEHGICFLLAYLDAHVAINVVSEMKSQEVMEYLMDHYDVNIEF